MIEGIPTSLASLFGVTPTPAPGASAPAAANGEQPDFDALLAMLGVVTEGDAPVDVPEGGTPAVTGEDASPEGDSQPFVDAEPLSAALDAGIGAVLALLAQTDAKPATPSASMEAAATSFAAAVAPALIPGQTTPAATPPTVAQEIEQAIPQGLQVALAAVTRALTARQAPGEPAKAEADATPLPGPDAAAATPPVVAATPAADAPPAAAAPASAFTATVTLASAILPPAPANDAAAAPQPAASEMGIAHHLKVEQDGQWLDQLARDIARTAAHDSQLRFKLNPEHLGSLAVEVTHRAEGAAIRFTADNEATRALIVDAQPKLMAEARAQGLRIAEAHVDLGAQGGGQGQGHAQSQQWFEDQKPFLRTHGLNAETPAESPGASDDERYA